MKLNDIDRLFPDSDYQVLELKVTPAIGRMLVQDAVQPCVVRLWP